MPRLAALLAVTAAVAACTGPAPAGAPEETSGPTVAPDDTTATPGELQLVGHEPLRGRGMNSALAVHGDHVYVGSRGDGSHTDGNVLVVDASDPTELRVVGEIGPPGAGNPGESPRELRVWPQQDLLVTLNLPCHPFLHACADRDAPTAFRFFDVAGDRASSPELLATHPVSPTSHEFFLWAGPDDTDRALLYVSTVPGVVVLDISDARDGTVTEVVTWFAPERRADIHSVSVSADGHRAYVSAMQDGVLILDTSDVAEGVPEPEVRELTSPATRPTWEGPGVHSAIGVPGSDVVLTTDEAYGEAAGGATGTGCPWAWMRLLDASDERAPVVVSEYRVDPWNTGCPEDPTDLDTERDRTASFSSHNPTSTRNVALVTWHAAGLQVVGIDDPAAPRQLASFVPEVDVVTMEDPALTSGTEKVAMWSYPVIQNGLIHVVDVRNGLYVLRYRGPFEEEVADIGFLEGNSNLGDAVSLDAPTP